MRNEEEMKQEDDLISLAINLVEEIEGSKPLIVNSSVEGDLIKIRFNYLISPMEKKEDLIKLTEQPKFKGVNIERIDSAYHVKYLYDE